ncbi:MAG: histidine kinase dimerization/phospho-acceptor domain-containing protein, partial [Candidatus Omnitrophica bacterium]|nr:histidine kinase dimerization/phospho-acceptor domain-containing protein [Candidatus Omnitrophota bacterium]
MFVFSSIFFLLVILYLGFVIAAKMDNIKQLQADVDTLKHNLDEMDEQPKLVVRTDIELHKTQEELDRKINSLYTLQKISRIISTFLEEKQIFKSIEAENLKELGFEKAIAFLYDEGRERFFPELTIGYEEQSFPLINQFIESHKTIFLDMIRREKTLSTISIPEGIPLREDIKNRFGAALFIISPILPKEGNKGLLFVGTTNADIPLTEGDEEVITVLSNQLGQSLENARLFEKTWRAQQESEHKVEEKTKDLKSALEEKEKISKRKTDFVSRVSHELRTPLTSVKGYASLLLAGKLGNLPEEAKQRIEKLNKHSDELVRMVNDLLDIARIESGKVTMKQEPVDLKRILDDVSDMLSVQ